MVIIFEQQNSCTIDTNWLQEIANKMIVHLGYDDFSVAIVLCEKDFIQNLNKIHRDKDYPTDILSFPNFTDIVPGQKIILKEQELKDLGDLIVCPEQIQQDAIELEEVFDVRMQKIIAHGLCHLLGYTHYTEEEHEKMAPLEDELLKL